MSTNLHLIGLREEKKPINCKDVDLGLFPTGTIYTYIGIIFILFIVGWERGVQGMCVG